MKFNRMQFSMVRLFPLFFLFISVLLVGCRPSLESIEDDPLAPSKQQPLNAESLKARIDRVLQYTYDKRHLNTTDHAAWQILHGALTYQEDFLVRHDGKYVSAVGHILEGGRMKGWTVERGFSYEDQSTGEKRFGLKAIMEPGTKTGQGHHDQWLAVISQCDLPSDTTIKLRGELYTIADFVKQVQLDASRNYDQEFSWTLIGLTQYLPTTATWKDAQGVDWGIEKMVQAEVDHGFNSGACGGTHRLIGLSMALKRHLASGGKLEGPWIGAKELIDRGIKTAKDFQNPNGSFSSNYFYRPGASPDLAEDLSTTGHTLEFLTIAQEVETLKEPWMMQAVDHMCEVFEKTEGFP